MNTASNQGTKGCGIANVPSAWYDLEGHIDSARAVLSCAQDYLPGKLEGVEYERINHVANLMEGALELLKLAQRDSEELERQLKAGIVGEGQ
ncbi:MAG: hypothetical protein OEV15_06675 [Gallionella sp.]|nr:hypothetical protein [Gallionella sp.]